MKNADKLPRIRSPTLQQLVFITKLVIGFQGVHGGMYVRGMQVGTVLRTIYRMRAYLPKYTDGIGR